MPEHFTIEDVGTPTSSAMDARLWFRVTWPGGGLGWVYFPMAQVVPTRHRSRLWVLGWLNQLVDNTSRSEVERLLTRREGLAIE